MGEKGVNVSCMCFDRMILKKDTLFKTDKEMDVLKQQYALHFHKMKYKDEDIYNAMLVNGLLSGNESVQSVVELYSNADELECYEYYNMYDPQNVFCRVCPWCVVNSNQFEFEELRILQLAKYAPSNIELIASFEEDGPIFNSMVTDDYFSENKEKGAFPTFTIPFTRLYFDKVLLGGMSNEDFLECIGPEYGDYKSARECAKKLLEQLDFVVASFNRVPMTKPVLKRIIADIHGVFGRTTKFPPVAFTGTKVRKSVSKKTDMTSVLSLSGKDDSTHTITTDSIKKSLEEEYAAAENKINEKNKGILGEENKTGKSIEKKKKITEKPVIKSDDKEIGIQTHVEIKQDKLKEPEEKEYSPCVIKPYFNMTSIKLMDTGKNKRFVSEIDNELKEKKYCLCELVNTENGDLLILYLERYNRYYKVSLDDEYAMKLIAERFKSKKVAIYTGMPWLLVDFFYQKHGVLLYNVYSLYSAYSLISNEDVFSLEKIIDKTLNISRKTYEDVLLYCIKNYKQAYEKIREGITDKRTADCLDTYRSIDAIYGVSFNRNLFSNGGGKLVSIDSNGKEIVYSGDVHLATSGVLFKIKLHSEDSSISKMIMFGAFARFFTAGNYKKCPFKILAVCESSVYVYVPTEDMYVFVFDFLAFYVKQICMERKAKCNMEIQRID
mgnify:CR=1 FL=1